MTCNVPAWLPNEATEYCVSRSPARRSQPWGGATRDRYGSGCGYKQKHIDRRHVM